MELWIKKAGRFAVGRHECPHPGVPVDLNRPRAGVGHTIEGSLSSGLAVFEQHFAPHFVVGDDAILQLVPLGMEATALEHDTSLPFETNRWAVAQIELEGNSDLDLWVPPKPRRERLEALLYELRERAGIPLRRPFEHGLQRGVTWATASNPRRTVSPARWGTTAGWFMHLEIPGNEHWDMGNVDWPLLLEGARHAGQAPRWTVKGGSGRILGHTKADGAASMARWAQGHKRMIRDHDTITFERDTR